MSRAAVPSSLVRFLAALLATIAVGAGVIVVTSIQNAPTRGPGNVPTPAERVGYRLVVRVGDAGRAPIEIASDGVGCEPLEPSDLLYRACVLSTNVDAAVIASEAFGRLNLEYSAVTEALIWRARLSEGPGFCDEAGLEGVFLERCTTSVLQETYAVEDADIEVLVDRMTP